MADKNSPPKRKRRRTAPGISHADIARAAGVSPGLVSAFFSGNHYTAQRRSGIGISDASRHKIRETCIRLGYIPDSPVSFFRLYPEKADVAFLLNEVVDDGFSNPYHSLLFEGFARSAFGSEVDLSNLFFRSDRDYLANPEALPNAILRNAVKKVGIASQPTNDSLIHQLIRMELAVVLVGNATPIDGVVSVVPDYREAARLGVHKLHEFGHRNFVIAGYERNKRRDIYGGRQTLEGLATGFREIGKPFDEGAILVAKRGSQELADQLVAMKKRPTAVFCLEDQLARELSLALMERGLKLPKDMSLLGCNDDRINQEKRPGFSSIHLPCRKIGARAFAELNRIAVEGTPEKHETVVLPVNFVDQGSILQR